MFSFKFLFYFVRVKGDSTKAKARPIPIPALPGTFGSAGYPEVSDGAGAVLLGPGQSGDAGPAEPSAVAVSHGWARGQQGAADRA